MKEFGLLKRRNFTKGAPEPTSTEKKKPLWNNTNANYYKLFV